MLTYFKNISVEHTVTANVSRKTYTFSEWKSKGFSDNVIKAFIKINNLIACPGLIYDGFKSILEFRGQCLKTELDIYHQYAKIINMYTVYELSLDTYNYDFALKNCLFGSVNVIQDNDIDKYEYSGYGIGFDSRGSFSYPDRSIAQNAIIFGVNMSSSEYANKTKNILILGEGFTQGLDHTMLYAEKNIQLILLKIIQNFV